MKAVLIAVCGAVLVATALTPLAAIVSVIAMSASARAAEAALPPIHSNIGQVPAWLVPTFLGAGQLCGSPPPAPSSAPGASGTTPSVQQPPLWAVLAAVMDHETRFTPKEMGTTPLVNSAGAMGPMQMKAETFDTYFAEVGPEHFSTTFGPTGSTNATWTIYDETPNPTSIIPGASTTGATWAIPGVLPGPPPSPVAPSALKWAPGSSGSAPAAVVNDAVLANIANPTDAVYVAAKMLCTDGYATGTARAALCVYAAGTRGCASTPAAAPAVAWDLAKATELAQGGSGIAPGGDTWGPNGYYPDLASLSIAAYADALRTKSVGQSLGSTGLASESGLSATGAILYAVCHGGGRESACAKPTAPLKVASMPQASPNEALMPGDIASVSCGNMTGPRIVVGVSPTPWPVLTGSSGVVTVLTQGTGNTWVLETAHLGPSCHVASAAEPWASPTVTKSTQAGPLGTLPAGVAWPGTPGKPGSRGTPLLPINWGALKPNPQLYAAVLFVYNEIGTPYVWGGATPHVGVDCSGLTMLAYEAAGIGHLEHFAQTQMHQLTATTTPVPGDLVFFAQPTGYVEHVGMVVGSKDPGTGVMIDAPYTGVDVREDTFPAAIGATFGGLHTAGYAGPPMVGGTL